MKEALARAPVPPDHAYRFCKINRFDQNFVITIGVDFRMKTVTREYGSERRTLRLQVWDTAGQERFRTITPAYYRSAMGVVMCYDITDENSFQNVEMWLHNLEQHGSGDVCKILLGNKADLEDKRKVAKERGFELAARHNMQFYETSAKTGDSVETAFNDIADSVVRTKYLPAGAPPAGAAAAGVSPGSSGGVVPPNGSSSSQSGGAGAGAADNKVTITAENATSAGKGKGSRFAAVKKKCAC